MNRSSAEKKKKKGRGLIVAIIALLVAGGGGTAVYFAKGIDKSTDRSSEYREYMVQKGNITIGTNESGTVSIERKYVSYPCAAEVE